MSSVTQKNQCFSLSTGVCRCFQAAHDQLNVHLALDPLALAESEQGVQAAQSKLLHVLLVVIALETPGLGAELIYFTQAAN